MRIDLFADVICPWCFIGTANLKAALARFDGDVVIGVRSFQLDPYAPERPERLGEYLGGKYGHERVANMLASLAARGAEAGIVIDQDPAVSLVGNTLAAHRILQAAGDHQLAVLDGLYRAYFSERRSIFDTNELMAIATSAGMPRAGVAQALTDDAYRQQVAADVALARELGITGVPFFVIDDRFGVSGAQPVEVLVRVLEQARGDRPAAVASA